MKLSKPTCPACGKFAEGTLETIQGVALLTFGEDGRAEYAGETRVDWDAQQSVTDRAGRVTLVCQCGNAWKSAKE